MHPEAFAFVESMLVVNGQPKSVVEIGSRYVNGSVRPLFTTERYIGIDLEPGPQVDIVADATSWRPPALVEWVVCCEVLEHAHDVPGIVSMAAESLIPGGVFLVTCATDFRAPHSGHDGGPLRPDEYYQNVDPIFLRRLLCDHDFRTATLEVWPGRGDLYAFGILGR